MKLRHFTLSLLFAVAGVASAADSQLLGLVMPDAKVVSGVDVTHIKSTPFGQFFLSQFLADAGFKELVTTTGFDPRRDVHELLMASQGDPKLKTALLLVRGAFDTAKVLPMLQSSGVTVENYKGVPLFTGKGTVKQATAFFDNTLLVSGDLESVRGTIDRRTSPSKLEATLLSKINQTSVSQDVWMVSTAPVSSFAAAAPDRNMRGALQGDAFKAIEQSSGSIRFGNIIEINGELVARTDADASSLADVLKFLANLIQMNGNNGQGAQFASLFRNLNVSPVANSVKFSLMIPETDVETLVRTGRAGRARI